MTAPPFRTAFDHARGRVRFALIGRGLLDGATIGGGAGAVAALALWGAGRSAALPVGLGVMVSGVLLGLLSRFRRRWSDADVALFLDARLTHDEAISTALEQHATSTDVAIEITARANAALGAAAPSAARPAVWRRAHGLLPLALAAIVGVHVLPERAPAASRDARADRKIARLDGLRHVEELKRIDTVDAAERSRIDALAEAARRLQENAQAGVDRKEALDALAKLRDGVDAERRSLSDARNRPGLEAATRTLGRHAELEAAARALGNGDLAALDAELHRLANTAEARSREIARQSLDEAEEAARAHGAPNVERALNEQRRLLKQRSAQSDALRRLATLLGSTPARGDVQRQLERLDRGDAGAQESLAQALADALESMSDAERQRVAQGLRSAAEGAEGEAQAVSRDQMERLARELSTPEGKQRLRQALASMGKGERSAQAGRARALALAASGIADAQRALSGEGSGNGSGSGQSPASGDAPGGGPGQHAGETPTVPGSAMPARAAGNATPGGVPIAAGGVMVSSPAVPGETARERGEGALGAVAPAEVGAVERANVPKEYRDQVGRYFAPR